VLAPTHRPVDVTSWRAPRGFITLVSASGLCDGGCVIGLTGVCESGGRVRASLGFQERRKHSSTPALLLVPFPKRKEGRLIRQLHTRTRAHLTDRAHLFVQAHARAQRKEQCRRLPGPTTTSPGIAPPKRAQRDASSQPPALLHARAGRGGHAAGMPAVRPGGAPPRRGLVEHLQEQAPRKEVNQSIALRHYLHSADLLVAQAAQYRACGNEEQLYVMLMRLARCVQLACVPPPSPSRARAQRETPLFPLHAPPNSTPPSQPPNPPIKPQPRHRDHPRPPRLCQGQRRLPPLAALRLGQRAARSVAPQGGPPHARRRRAAAPSPCSSLFLCLPTCSRRNSRMARSCGALDVRPRRRQRAGAASRRGGPAGRVVAARGRLAGGRDARARGPRRRPGGGARGRARVPVVTGRRGRRRGR
jgi:hypothetical protein